MVFVCLFFGERACAKPLFLLDLPLCARLAGWPTAIAEQTLDYCCCLKYFKGTLSRYCACTKL